MILMELFKWAAIGIGSAAAVIIFVALLNTLYHRLVIRRRTKKLDPFLEDWERHQIQGRMLRHGRPPEAKHFVLGQSEMPEQLRTAPVRAKGVQVVGANNYNTQRPILYVPHSMWCPTCGGHSLDVRQPGEGSLPTYACAGCGQGFCVKAEEPKRWDRDVIVSTPVNDDMSEFLGKIEQITREEARSIETDASTGHWPDVHTTLSDPETKHITESDLYSWSPDRNSVVTNPNFGGGDFAGGGAGQDYGSSESSTDSGSSYDSGSSDSDYGSSSDNSSD